MAKELKLEDLTKEELIEVINQQIFIIEPRVIANVHWHNMTQKSQQLMKEGLSYMKKAESIKDFRGSQSEHEKGSKIFEQGDKLAQEAEKFYREYLNG